MNYLYIFPLADGKIEFEVHDSEPLRDDLAAVYDGNCALLRFHNGAFELAEVETELSYEYGEPKTHYYLERWKPVG